MDAKLNKLFADFDSGTITRRQLLQALGLAAIAAPALAQGGAEGSGEEPVGQGGLAALAVPGVRPEVAVPRPRHHAGAIAV